MNRWIFLIGIVTGGCTFAPEATKPLTQVSPDPPATVNITLNDISEDTIRLSGPVNFSYSIQTSGTTIRESEVIFAGVTLVKSLTIESTGTFSISGSTLRSGTFELKIQFVSNSGTGSLADQAGAENIQVWRKWIVIIDIDPPSKPVLTASTQNGFLTLSWTPYAKDNFVKYTFYRNGYFSMSPVVITDRNVTSYVDSAFMGGVGYYNNYTVSVKNIHGEVSSEVVNVSSPQDLQYSYNVADSSASFTWLMPPYPGAFKEVVISEDGVARITLTDPQVTSQVLQLQNVLMGRSSRVSIEIKPKYPDYGSFTAERGIDNPTGARKTFGGQRFFMNASNQLMGLNGSFLRTYDSDMRVIDSVIVPDPKIPYPGQYLYYVAGNGVRKYNISTKQTQTLTTFGPYGSPWPPINFSGSTNQLTSYFVIDRTYFWDLRYRRGIVDMTSGTVLEEVSAGYSPGGLTYVHEFSDDGKYAFYRNFNGVFRLTSGAPVQIGSITSLGFGSFYAFRPDNCEEMILIGSIALGPRVNIVRSSDLTLLRSIDPPATGYSVCGYDPVTDRIIFCKSNGRVVYLVHIETEHVIAFDASSDGASFMNGILFVGNGYWKKIL